MLDSSIGDARQQTILECAPLLPDLDRIVAKYAQLTGCDIFDILCTGESGDIKILTQKEYGYNTMSIDENIHWENDTRGMHRCKIFVFEERFSRNKKSRSRYIDLSRFTHGNRPESPYVNVEYLKSRDPKGYWDLGKYWLFIDALDKLTTHIV